MIGLNNKVVIAIDGYSSCGKSSFAKLIAEEVHYIYLDSGAMYRAIALFAMRNNLIKEKEIDAGKLVELLPKIKISFAKDHNGFYTLLNDENVETEIRGAAVSSNVSVVSKIRQVRERLVQIQQAMGREKGIVMDGRDIGTVVFPFAEIKIFMVADIKVRAIRRYEELIIKGIETNLEDIAANIQERDFQDMHRDISPLRRSDDSFVLDNSNMTFDQQMIWFVNILKEKKLVT